MLDYETQVPRSRRDWPSSTLAYDVQDVPIFNVAFSYASARSCLYRQRSRGLAKKHIKCSRSGARRHIRQPVQTPATEILPDA